MEIKQYKISDINPAKYNPRKITDEELSGLKESIKKFGFVEPLIINKRTNTLCGGHQRLKAAEALAYTEIPVVEVDLSLSEEKALNIALNSPMISGKYDHDILKDLLEEIKDDMGQSFEDLRLDDLVVELGLDVEPNVVGLVDEDSVPEVKEPIAKPGDIWILGNHRVMCGDSTMIDQVDKLMPENSDITFTSPPYNIGGGASVRRNMYLNDEDNKSDSEYLDFLLGWTAIALSKTDYTFHNNQMLESNKKVLIKYQYALVYQIKDILVWNKKISPPHINPGTFSSKYEFVFCLSQKDNNKSFPCKWQGKFPNVIETESNSSNDYGEVHKAGFPVAFPLWVIEKMDFAKTVYDPFLGTGSTLIACEKTNRKCYGMEIDPHYCDVIINRWQDFTGKEAIHEDGKKYNSLKNQAETPSI